MSNIKINNEPVFAPFHRHNGYVVGAISGFIVSMVKNQKAIKKGKKDLPKAIKHTLKTTVIGAVTVGTATTAAEKILKKDYVNASIDIALGASAIYILENISTKEQKS